MPIRPQPVRAPRPLADADLSRVEAVFTDVDGTLTSDDRLESSTVRAIEQLHEAGLKVVLVSGRPAGWGECWARQLPVDAVVVENGGLWFLREGKGIRKVYAQPPAVRTKNRARLAAEVDRAMAEEPGARLSSDSAYTEVDLAIDWNEEVHLGVDVAERLQKKLGARGITAVRSSVHVNCWIGNFDKRVAVERIITRHWKLTHEARDPRWLYVGDSFNDAPMFEAFALSVGVANVRDVLDRISHPPAFITRSREGTGFRELARAVLARRPR
jgi:HAD superfamily hydrolase (TIGR01484 family)